LTQLMLDIKLREHAPFHPITTCICTILALPFVAETS
jgi:hypothetical protein